MNSLIGPKHGFCDLSLKFRSREFTWAGGSSRSKLDRFLCSNRAIRQVTSYTVDSHTRFGFDHRLITINMKVRKPHTVIPDRPRFWHLNIDKLSTSELGSFQQRVNSHMGPLLDSIQNTSERTLGQSKFLNRHFEVFSEIIHDSYWQVRSGSEFNRSLQRINLKDVIAGRVGPFLRKMRARKKPPTRAQLLRTTLRKVRSLKRRLRELEPSKQLSNDFQIQIVEALEIEISHRDITFVFAKRALREKIDLINADLFREKQKLGHTSKAERDRLFHSSRKTFNRKNLKGEEVSYEPLSMILDPAADRIVTSKNEVSRVVRAEAAKILCNPKPPPTTPPPWFENAYKPGASIADLQAKGFSWEGITDPFTLPEIFEAISAKKNSAPGFDKISKKVLGVLVRNDSGAKRAL